MTLTYQFQDLGFSWSPVRKVQAAALIIIWRQNSTGNSQKWSTCNYCCCRDYVAHLSPSPPSYSCCDQWWRMGNVKVHEEPLESQSDSWARAKSCWKQRWQGAQVDNIHFGVQHQTPSSDLLRRVFKLFKLGRLASSLVLVQKCSMESEIRSTPLWIVRHESWLSCRTMGGFLLNHHNGFHSKLVPILEESNC